MSQDSAATLAVVTLLVGSMIGAGLTLGAVGSAPGGDRASVPQANDSAGSQHGSIGVAPTAGLTNDTGVGTFENESTFRAYVERGSLLADGGRSGDRVRTVNVAAERPMVEEDRAVTAEAADAGVQVGGDGGDGGSPAAPSRVANTNVQVAGLDEPDVVKTDGRHFYYAPQDGYTGGGGAVIEPEPGPRGGSGDDIAPPTRTQIERDTHVVDASDPANPEAVANINTSGKLLQTGETLVVFEDDRIAGYDVSDPAEPTEVWSTKLNGTLVTAREQDGTLYVVTETSVGTGAACPIEPLGEANPIDCEDVHRPDTQIPVDATYSAFTIEARSGDVEDSTSFVGTSRNSVVYVSGTALYVTYTKPTSRAAITAEFVREEFDRAPAHLEDRIAEIQSYDITPESKEREMRRAIDRWFTSLPADEQESVRESFREGFRQFVADHQRELTQTGIVRVATGGDDLSVEATGTVPGRPLNQFSLDEHNGTLRVTTTIPGRGSADSENDLYVLDSDSLDQRGTVTGMGVTERVYSVRYVDDTAYIVTFRRIDPFHVVDLSDPEDPEEVGELELPGFSSYLHPVDDDHVLGVGEENGRVKTVLFDVSDPSDPTIADSTVLDQGWSAVSRSHHAFLMDRKHGVFVLPAGQQSVVMDYTDESLSVEATIRTDGRATRSRYVGDYLYVFAGDTLTVVDESTWNRTQTLHLGS